VRAGRTTTIIVILEACRKKAFADALTRRPIVFVSVAMV